MIVKITPLEQTGIKFTDDEFQTIREVFHDWGLLDMYFIADWDKVQTLKKKLNTEEEIDYA